MYKQSSFPLSLSGRRRSEALRLSDRYGYWCAWCLNYIKAAAELELHHMIARAHAEEILGRRQFLDSWLVPVHKGWCHRSLQRFSDSATLRLAEDASRSLRSLIARSREAFYGGELSRGLFLRELVHARFASIQNLDPQLERTNLIHTFNCGAGSVLVTRLVTSPSRIASEWRKRLQNDPLGDSGCKFSTAAPFWQFFAADIYANAGAYQTAKRIIREAEDILPRVFKSRYSAAGALARRKGLLLADLKSANEAAATAQAENDWYNYRTALLGRGWALFVNGDPNGALDNFYSVIENPQPLRLSFWHQFCAEFALGCVCLSIEGARGLELATSALIRSQYLSALLGLQGNPVPDPRFPDAPAPSFITPTDMLHWICERFSNELTSERLKELRNCCLKPMRDDLLSRIAHGYSPPESIYSGR